VGGQHALGGVPSRRRTLRGSATAGAAGYRPSESISPQGAGDRLQPRQATVHTISQAVALAAAIADSRMSLLVIAKYSIADVSRRNEAVAHGVVDF